jgi:hypothetical protein
MRLGRAIIIPAILALGTAGTILAGSAASASASASAAPTPAAQVQSGTSSVLLPRLHYHA